MGKDTKQTGKVKRAPRPRLNHLEERQILTLRIEGHTPESIAVITGRSITSVYKVLRRLRYEPNKKAELHPLYNLNVTPRSE